MVHAVLHGRLFDIARKKIPGPTVCLEAEEVVDLTGFLSRELAELTELGLLQPLRDGDLVSPGFSIGRRAMILRGTFELDLAGLALVVRLLARIDALEARLQEQPCQLPREKPGGLKESTKNANSHSADRCAVTAAAQYDVGRAHTKVPLTIFRLQHRAMCVSAQSGSGA
jgi:hypothetical protein